MSGSATGYIGLSPANVRPGHTGYSVHIRKVILVLLFLGVLGYFYSSLGRSQPGLKCADTEKVFAIVIDAGSTGSRSHVYEFETCQTATDSAKRPVNPKAENGSHPDPATNQPRIPPRLIGEDFYSIQPGLSSYNRDVPGAVDSIKTLVERAKSVVPQAQWSCTPITVKATAGLRLLGDEAERILDGVRAYLEREPFPLGHVGGGPSGVDDAVSVMGGSEEAVFAWVTVNYLIGRTGLGAAAMHDSSGSAAGFSGVGGMSLPSVLSAPTSASDSAAVLDLGGASTQIVFQPKDEHIRPEHVYELSFSGRSYRLYEHSHLGYGLMQARKAVNRIVAFTYLARRGGSEWPTLRAVSPVDPPSRNHTIPNPCMFDGTRKDVELDGETVTMLGTGAGFAACRRVVELAMAKDDRCHVGPCGFGGVYQPAIERAFPSGPIFALSYFYDRVAPLGLTSPFTVGALRDLAKTVCDGPEQPSGNASGGPSGGGGWARFGREALVELGSRPESCLDLTYMVTLLGFGYGIGDERFVGVAKSVDGVELGWALGVGLALADGGQLKCLA